MGTRICLHSRRGRADFPKAFKKCFDDSGLTLRQIAEKLNIKLSRLEHIVYSRYKMDCVEFKLVQGFCSKAYEEVSL